MTYVIHAAGGVVGLLCTAFIAAGLMDQVERSVISEPPAVVAADAADAPGDSALAAPPVPTRVESAMPERAAPNAAGVADGMARTIDHTSRNAGAPPGAGPAGGLTVYRVCRVTAYCDRGLTASGVQAGLGQCAAPRDIPFGSTVYIPALDRTFVVTDRTHRRFRHNTVDLFMTTRDACRKFGCQYLDCVITLPSGKRLLPNP